MCRPTRCRTCGGTTWAGCGNHVEQVMANVPEGRRCTCDDDATGGDRDDRPSLFARIFGR